MMMEVSRPPEYASTTFSRIGTPRRKAVNAAFQQQNHDGFLNVQAILCLIKHHRTRRIDHRRRHLISAMRRQAVHEERVLGGIRKQLRVHLEGKEYRSEEHTSELQSRQYLVCR